MFTLTQSVRERLGVGSTQHTSTTVVSLPVNLSIHHMPNSSRTGHVFQESVVPVLMLSLEALKQLSLSGAR